MPTWHFSILVVTHPPLQVGRLRLSMAVSACFLDLGNAQRGEGTQPCCRERGPCGWVGSREHRVKQSPAPTSLVCSPAAASAHQQEALVQASDGRRPREGCVYRLATWQAEAQRCTSAWEGRLPGREKDSPRGGALPRGAGRPKCFADNRMRLNNVILCTSRWDDGVGSASQPGGRGP